MAYEKEQLRTMFQQKFDQEKWLDFLVNFFKANGIRRNAEYISLHDGEGEGQYWGTMETTDHYAISLFYIRAERSIVKRRVGLRRMITPFIKVGSDAGLCVFDDGEHWRLSLISDLKDEATAPKRYTFVFGDSTQRYNTAVARFLELQTKGINYANIKDAFSVEALTKQFYNELFEWYQWAVEPNSGITFPNNTATPDDDKEDIDIKIIRLITRIMFVWFIKQKELVPNKIFDVDYLKTVLKDFDELSSTEGNYYNAILQNLFFATLNRAIEDENGKRRFAHNVKKDVKTLYRYAEMFSISEEEVIDMFADVPFLNGGLFECLDKVKTLDGVEKAFYYDGFSRNTTRFANGRYTQRAVVPNIFFFDQEKGLLTIFNRYNFTIEENSPNEQQVALDPELLGKVFENLLGAYNPETQETARNQSGSFYTPREIVDYMTDESLKAYLGQSPVVDSLFSEEFERKEEFNDEYQAIAEKLKNIKVIDPACGSGAFPMGLLNRIVDLLKKINPNESTYKLKLAIIENCIYGSDIQSIATQISKLRFFISLICDCEKDNSKPNFGIPTLPNLETKFVAANSLLSKKKRNQQLNLFEDPRIQEKKDELSKVRHLHFSAKTANQKRELRLRDEQLRKELSELLSNSLYAPEDAIQIAMWNPYDQNSVASFFDPEWMFDVKEFDIVIGNPPYISTKGVKDDDKKAYEKEFGFSDDTYNLFTFKGLSLCKNGGTLNYIIPKTFWTTQTKRNMRDLLLDNTINYIFDTANPFEAVMVDTCIIQVMKKPYQNGHSIKVLDGTKELAQPFQFPTIEQSIYRNAQNSVFFKPTELNLRIYNLYGEKVKELYDKWWDKIKTSRDIEKNKAELETYRKSLKPGDIALLGCLTEGGQGLATANNGKYIAVRKSTKWAKKIIESRPKKLAEAIKKRKIVIPEMAAYVNEKEFLSSLSESEIASLFDRLKEQFGRDIFGQGYLYKLIDDSEMADVDKLTDDEKQNGIDTSKNYYVPYDKGDKDGNRWFLETPFAIAWSKENVHFLKTNSGKKGEGMPVVRNPQFYFREGLCWSDINTTFLKCRKKQKSINDVKSMSLFGPTEKVPENYIIALINTKLMSYYVDTFVNNTQTFQINDARQIPVVIPQASYVDKTNNIVERAISIKTHKQDEFLLKMVQVDDDTLFEDIYGVKP